ncbi:MAG: hypothetical protein DME17_11675 [Candidatus Rokuibacteriota bacterium]|nr:MAG: hypothetical protein DME17_11675 [Candidatus Rokubacteria bacterium]
MREAETVTVVARIYPKAGKDDEVAALLVQMAEAVRHNEPDCLVYRPHRLAGHGGAAPFFFYEQYRSKEAFDLHRSAPPGGLPWPDEGPPRPADRGRDLLPAHRLAPPERRPAEGRARPPAEAPGPPARRPLPPPRTRAARSGRRRMGRRCLACAPTADHERERPTGPEAPGARTAHRRGGCPPAALRPARPAHRSRTVSIRSSGEGWEASHSNLRVDEWSRACRKRSNAAASASQDDRDRRSRSTAKRSAAASSA